MKPQLPELPPVNTTYEPFSEEPEYVELNRAFVARRDLSHARRILDLACGNGLVSGLLLASAPHAHLHGLDYDPVQIELMTEKLVPLGYEVRRGVALTEDRVNGKPVVTLTVGDAQRLPFPDESFDCVTIGNAIHAIPDKDKMLAEVRRVLQPGGTFGFSSSFYAGTFPEGTHHYYTEWIKLAIQFIEKYRATQAAAGAGPVKRVRGTRPKAFQNRWLAPPEWVSALARHDLLADDVFERSVMLNGRCFAAVGAYGGMAEVLISGYPVELASAALQTTAEPAMQAIGLTAVPRNWLEVWAKRR